MKKTVLIVLIICGIIAGGVFIGAILQNANSATSNQDPGNITQADSSSASSITDATKTFTKAQVAERSTPDNCWIIIEKGVYDVGAYLDKHPGGADQITPFCGKDATQAFVSRGGSGSHSESANTIKQDYLIGTIGN